MRVSRRADAALGVDQQAECAHGLVEGAGHAAGLVMERRDVAVERDRDLVRALGHHALGHLRAADAGAVDHREDAQAHFARRGAEAEILFEIEHRLAAADHEIALGVHLGELGEDLGLAREGEVVGPVVVVPLPEVAMGAAQVAALVHLHEHEAGRRDLDMAHGVGLDDANAWQGET